MDWLSLEGIPRVKASYQVWKRCKRILRYTRKHPLVTRQTVRFLKEDVQNEYEELVDAILSLNRDEFRQLLTELKPGRLYDIACSLEN
jgi:hypothetical protein